MPPLTGAWRAGFDEFVARHLEPTRSRLVPEIVNDETRDLVGLWEALEARFGDPQEPPFWAVSWRGSHALARYLLDNPRIVRGRMVVDPGS